MRIESAGTVKISTDFGPENVDAADFEAIKFARQNKDLSREKYLSELKRRGVLPDEFNETENEQELEDEMAAFMDAEAQIDAEADIAREEAAADD